MKRMTRRERILQRALELAIVVVPCEFCDKRTERGIVHCVPNEPSCIRIITKQFIDQAKQELSKEKR